MPRLVLLEEPETVDEAVQMVERAHDEGRLSEFLEEDSKRGELFRNAAAWIEEKGTHVLEEDKAKFPLKTFWPAYEQCLKFNAWVWGINFNCDFDANRIGKTAGGAVGAFLWMYPNNPAWKMFQANWSKEWNCFTQVFLKPRFDDFLDLQDYLDEHPELRGDPSKIWWHPDNLQKFCKLAKIFPGFFPQPEGVVYSSEPGEAPCQNKAIQPKVPAWPEPAFTDRRNTIWLGGPDNDFLKDIVFPEWREWVPKNTVTRDSEHDLEISLKIPYTTRFGAKKFCEWEIEGKSYESKDTKWAGAAVRGIVLTEGVTKELLSEIRQRFKDRSFASWDYTPYEPRNTGRRSLLADKVYRRKEQLPLRSHVFTGFGIDRIPTRILPLRKKKDLIRQWEGKPEGIARIHGKFYSNSPVALSNLSRDIHTVSWTKKELFQRYPEGIIIRSVDLGYDHPTVCMWWLVTRGNLWFCFRRWAASGLSIGDRCAKIVELSGNKRYQHFWGKGDDDYYYVEYHPDINSEPVLYTIADYHLFKQDEKNDIPYIQNYIKEGLIVHPSTTMQTKDRVNELNRLLEVSQYRLHPETRKAPAPKVFFLLQEEGIEQSFEFMENLYWARFSKGDMAGEPKDAIQEHDDDDFDSASYGLINTFQWNSMLRPKRIYDIPFASLQTWQQYLNKKISEIPAGTLEKFRKYQESHATTKS